MHISYLNQNGIDQLTSVLILRPGEDAIKYSNRTLAAIKNLPQGLQKDSRLSLMFRNKEAQHKLCALHHNLNSELAQTLLNLIGIETGSRLNPLAVNLPLLPEHQQKRIQRVRQVQEIWLGIEVFLQTFPNAKSFNKWQHQTDQCPACSIARMAGDLQFVMDLLAVVASRHQREDATLPRYLTSFLQHHRKGLSLNEERKIRDEIEEATADLRKWRAKFHRMRLSEGVKSGQPLRPSMQRVPADPVIDARSSVTRISSRSSSERLEDRDTVLSFVNLYADVTSTAHLPPDEMEIFRQNTPKPFKPSPLNLVDSYTWPMSIVPEVPDKDTEDDLVTPKASKFTQSATPNAFERNNQESRRSSRAEYVPPRADWRSNKSEDKGKQLATHAYLAKDARVSEEDWYKSRYGGQNPWSSSTESLRSDGATVIDRKDAYRQLSGQASQASITSSAVARPKLQSSSKKAASTHTSIWDDETCPPSPPPISEMPPLPLRPPPLEPRSLRPQSSSIYSQPSPLSTPRPEISSRGTTPARESELGFETWMRQNSQRKPKQDRSRADSVASVYSQSSRLSTYAQEKITKSRQNPPITTNPTQQWMANSHRGARDSELVSQESPSRPNSVRRSIVIGSSSKAADKRGTWFP